MLIINRPRHKVILSLVGLFILVFSFSFLSGKFNQPIDPTQALDQQLNLNIEPILSLSIDNPSLNLQLQANTLSEISTNIHASTNNIAGYTLILSDSEDDDTNLINQNFISQIIPTLSSATIKTNFPNNYYGYSLNGTDYFAIPSAFEPKNLKQTNTPSSDQINLKLAAKVDQNTMPGIYHNTLELSIIANRVRTPIFSISTMQEMTPRICKDTTTPYAFENGASSGNIVATTTLVDSLDRNLVPERTLIDTRDNKTYVVRKLADGRCWMVQNLDLDLSTSVTLTDEDTNLYSKESWTPENSTHSNTGVVWGNDNQQASSSAHSYNTGDIYYPSSNNTPTNHAGNYYNWYAATAGSGTYDTAAPDQGARDSICPRGWRLPIGKYDDTEEFKYLINIYRINGHMIMSPPFSFILSGDYYYDDGKQYNKDYSGAYWTNSVHSQDKAYILYFHQTHMNPLGEAMKGRGFSVRCIANDFEPV